MEPTEYPPMSGSNTICTATVLLETGMVAMTEPETTLRLDNKNADAFYNRGIAYFEKLAIEYRWIGETARVIQGAVAGVALMFAGTRFVKRITLVARDGTIEKVFYPVFPPDRNAEAVAAWLRGHP